VAKNLLGIPRALIGRLVVATATLFGILTGHSILETARDALFLSSLPASQLPWVYLVIAGLALVVARLNQRVTSRYSGRATLALTLFGSAVCTAGLWLWAGRGETSLYGLYVWTGVMATVIVVQLWLLVADAFHPGVAKRSRSSARAAWSPPRSARRWPALCSAWSSRAIWFWSPAA
jgi:hypothetical protein